MKVFRRLNYLQIDFSDGGTYSTDECTDDMWNFLKKHQGDEKAVKRKFLNEASFKGEKLLDKVKNSKILTLRGSSVYMLSVSELSIPEDFVSKIVEAEEERDELELKKLPSSALCT